MRMTDCLNAISAYNIRQAVPAPRVCALMVIDMQEYFRSIAYPILARACSVIKACRSRKMPVIFTRHGHRDISRDGGMLAEWWGDYIRYGSGEWELIKELQADNNKDIILDKNRYSAFYGTKLDAILGSLGIRELIITGVLTNCCCETTARDAFVRDYRVFFAGDATSTVDGELHLASLKNLAFGFAHIVSADQLCRALG